MRPQASGRSPRSAQNPDRGSHHEAPQSQTGDTKCMPPLPLIAGQWGFRKCFGTINDRFSTTAASAALQSVLEMTPSARRVALINNSEQKPEHWKQRVFLVQKKGPKCCAARGWQRRAIRTDERPRDGAAGDLPATARRGLRVRSRSSARSGGSSRPIRRSRVRPRAPGLWRCACAPALSAGSGVRIRLLRSRESHLALATRCALPSPSRRRLGSVAPWAPVFAGVTSFLGRAVRIAPLGDRNCESSRLDGAGRDNDPDRPLVLRPGRP